MLDDPALVEMKRKANTRSLKEMATLLRYMHTYLWLDDCFSFVIPIQTAMHRFESMFSTNLKTDMFESKS